MSEDTTYVISYQQLLEDVAEWRDREKKPGDKMLQAGQSRSISFCNILNVIRWKAMMRREKINQQYDRFSD